MFVCPSVRPFVRSSVTSFSRDWLISFWFLARRCKMAMPKMWRSPILENKIFWANFGQKLPKNRVFWTLCKIASLVFSNFWQKDRGQCLLKNNRKDFSWKILFVVNYGFSFFGEIPFYHFPIPCFFRDWLINFCWFLAQRCKIAMLKMWRSPIFEKNFFWANLGQKLPKNRVFGLCAKLLH